MCALDTGDISNLLRAIEGSRYRDVYFVALYTGLRRSELLALRWHSVDLDAMTIKVVAGLHRLTGRGLILLPTKTESSRRTIAIEEEVADVLRQNKGAQILRKIELESIWHSEGFVFTHSDGAPLDPEKVTKEFSKVTHQAGMKGVRLHDLRHSHASLMLKAGVQPKVISERLGHSSISVTMDIYGHVLPGLQEDAARRFSTLLNQRDER